MSRGGMGEVWPGGGGPEVNAAPHEEGGKIDIAFEAHMSIYIITIYLHV